MNRKDLLNVSFLAVMLTLTFSFLKKENIFEGLSHLYWNMMNRFFFFLLILFSGNLFASENLPPLLVAEDNYSRSDFTLNLFVDHEQKLTIQDISNGQLTSIETSSRFNIPIEEANYWFSFTLKNNGLEAVKRVIQFDEPFLFNADIYYQQPNGVWVEEKNGLSVPLKERAVPNRLPVFIVPLEAGESKKIYLMMNCKQDLLTVGITVKAVESFLIDEQFEVAGYWFFFGISLAMLLYNLFLLFSLRDELYIYYTAYCASFFIFVLMYSGYDLYFVTQPASHYDLVVSISISVACLTLFIRKLLNSPVTLPYLDKLMLFIAFIFILQGALTYIDISNYYFVVFIGLPATLVLFFIGIYAFYKNIELSNYLVFGMSWHILGLFAIAAVNAGVIEHNFVSRYGFMIGSMVEVFVFSLALSHRVRLLQEKKNEFQYALIEREQREKTALKIEVARNQKALEDAQIKMTRLQQVDDLTGLFNRPYFDEEFEREWQLMQSKRQPLAIILLEFNELALFCDKYGKETADYTLRLLAQKLVGCVGHDADIVARYGDNQFAVLLPNYNKNKCNALIHKIEVSTDLVKIPFKESQSGQIDIMVVGDALIPANEIRYTMFLDHVESLLAQPTD
ncbi:hypothetical protein CW745_10470 [Psychromonas sp. psych-6C06]|uniref:sensor domain-containing diguanylate cyclase n=1 Tax=Psychromonas sp. psych-6C06 TaxID=2058089 RepID=UPI000C347AEB|nr:7TM diverse intracellular signaling domain-containing protein [Psychromonas sp. psych-6C06]PKF61733.1 hypothetical protein CW745_10470 [Psychromonas sp. psych-6C06]